MKGVPGVMTLESKVALLSLTGTLMPCAAGGGVSVRLREAAVRRSRSRAAVAPPLPRAAARWRPSRQQPLTDRPPPAWQTPPAASPPPAPAPPPPAPRGSVASAAGSSWRAAPRRLWGRQRRGLQQAGSAGSQQGCRLPAPQAAARAPGSNQDRACRRREHRSSRHGHPHGGRRAAPATAAGHTRGHPHGPQPRARTDGHVEQLAGAHDGEQAVDVVEHGEEHLLLGGGRGAVLRVEARVDDAVPAGGPTAHTVPSVERLAAGRMPRGGGAGRRAGPASAASRRASQPARQARRAGQARSRRPGTCHPSNTTLAPPASRRRRTAQRQPHMSRYRLSYSTPLGLGWLVSTGTSTPLITCTSSSTTSTTTLGYLRRGRAGGRTERVHAVATRDKRHGRVGGRTERVHAVATPGWAARQGGRAAGTRAARGRAGGAACCACRGARRPPSSPSAPDALPGCPEHRTTHRSLLRGPGPATEPAGSGRRRQRRRQRRMHCPGPLRTCWPASGRDWAHPGCRVTALAAARRSAGGFPEQSAQGRLPQPTEQLQRMRDGLPVR